MALSALDYFSLSLLLQLHLPSQEFILPIIQFLFIQGILQLDRLRMLMVDVCAKLAL
jgi:hypothetical protein